MTCCCREKDFNKLRYDPAILAERFPANRWGIDHCRIDPRHLGQGCARARVYILLWDKRQLRWTGKQLVLSEIEASLILFNVASEPNSIDFLLMQCKMLNSCC